MAQREYDRKGVRDTQCGQTRSADRLTVIHTPTVPISTLGHMALISEDILFEMDGRAQDTACAFGGLSRLRGPLQRSHTGGALAQWWHATIKWVIDMWAGLNVSQGELRSESLLVRSQSHTGVMRW